jgi:hypothetical protein
VFAMIASGWFDPLRAPLAIHYVADATQVLARFRNPGDEFPGYPRSIAPRCQTCTTIGAVSTLYQIGGPRSIQFALKLQF